jgi:hypothetical protein
MNAYFFGISDQERQNILDKHKEVYNGYQTLNPSPVSNNQPLYTQDFANDKGGLTVNNKGEVTKYKNMGINESVEEGAMCEQCGLTESKCKCGVNEELDEEMCEQGCSDVTEQVDDFSQGIKSLADNIIKSQEFSNLISKTDPSEFSDEFEFADNLISWSLSDYEDSPFYDELYDYIKDVHSEDFFDAYRVVMGDEFDDDDDMLDIDYEEMDEDIDDGEVASDVEPAYQFQSHGPEDVYGTMKDYDSEHPHHDYDSMEDVAKYDPSSDLENMFPDLDFGNAFSDEPSDTFQHDAGDVDREGDEGLGQDTENDMDLGSAKSGYNFFSGGSDGTGDDSEFNVEEDVDEDLREDFKETRKLTLEMFQRLSKFN